MNIINLLGFGKQANNGTLIRKHRIFIRLFDIFLSAPWAIFDFLSSSIVFLLGGYLILSKWLYDPYLQVWLSVYQKAYPITSRLGSIYVTGMLFIAIGSIGLLIVLWPTRPWFCIRLLARMSVAFCLLAFSLDLFGNPYPPAATPTYFILALAAIWNVWRTSSSGR